MPNLRIIHDNAADRATLTTSSAALPASNLRSELKSLLWRSTGLTATLTLTWPTQEMIGGVALAFTTLSPTHTIRVRGYALAADTTPVVDSGVVLGAPPAALGSVNWGEPLGQNFYSPTGLAAWGTGSYSRCWIEPASVSKIVIDLDDTGNSLGYIEVSRLIAGYYWEPYHNMDFGTQLAFMDTGDSSRSQAGDLRNSPGTQHRQFSFSLAWMREADRNTFLKIARINGRRKPFFISMFPENNEDPVAEQMYQMWCVASDNPAVNHPFYSVYSGSLELEEM